MKTTPLNDRLIQLTRYGFVNAYLVREDDGFTLVDTTVSRTGAALIAAAGAACAPIRRIALTHGHGDHVGSVGELKDSLGAEVQLLVPELDARILAGEKVVEGKVPGSWPKVTWTPDVRLQAGDTVGR
jgi:glyoxylase-like metal-dependent hydrolase (beta-lactamase superfamily II)